MFGFPEEKYIPILIIRLVKRQVAFNNAVTYLQNYYSSEKLMLENR